MARKKTSTPEKEAAQTKADVTPDVEDHVTDATDGAVSEDAETLEAPTQDETFAEDTAPQEAEPTEDEAEVILNQEMESEAQEDNSDAPESDPIPAPDPIATQTIVERKGGFVPMLLGGLVAGGIGFGAAFYLLPQIGGQDGEAFQQEVTTKLDQNANAIAGLTQTVNQIPEGPDMTVVDAAMSDMSAAAESLATRLDALESKFSALDDRLTTVEKRPISEGASDAAVAAYERELKALQDTMAAQRSELEAMASDAQSMESNAEETAKATMLRAALTRVQTALDTGAGFSAALGDLQNAGVSVPAALSDVAEDGVPSLTQLQASFPDAARAALAVSRREAANNGEEGGFSAFLKNQLGTRSLEPREGDDPDAVLSRAEAAARDGRLTDTLAEIEALPEVGRVALSDWTTQVARRQGAVAAAEALGQELN